ncbi:hypothetical protein L3X38_000329 [Prunus dulcis]|uniref:Uncharacterized protein n=1 Tax=Prunus dulcis TaxID=3755 RepID=A0AAD4YK21_PRUDU|nr:hypothetical protein L3X38_000329 [Prunus dulcis]
MHDMIYAIGREFVRLESEKPWKYSKVWQHKDSFNILTKKNGTDTIECLVLDMHMNLKWSWCQKPKKENQSPKQGNP